MEKGGSRLQTQRVALLLLCGFLAILLVASGSNGQAQPKAEISTRARSYQTELVSGDVKIPVLTGLKDSDLEEQINDRWYKDITGFVGEVKVTAQDFVDEFGDELRHWLPFEAAVDFKVGYLDERFVSIPIVYYSFTGGAHGFSYQESTNVDLLTGRELELKDLFVEGYDYSQVIESEVLRQMQTNSEVYFDDDMVDSAITTEHPFYLTPEGIIVYYGLYEVAPYSSGIPEFTIPFATVWEGLRPEFQAISDNR